jgi:hypothetical protein
MSFDIVSSQVIYRADRSRLRLIERVVPQFNGFSAARLAGSRRA